MKCKCIKEVKFSRIPIWFKLGKDYEFMIKNARSRNSVFCHEFGKSMGFADGDFTEHFSVQICREEKLDKLLNS